MTKAEKFKMLVEQKGYGSPIDVSSLQQPYQHLCERLLKFYRDFLIWLNDPKFASFPAGDIYLGITLKETVNAHAFKRNADPDEFIAIHTGSISLCFDDFLALFAHPSFLPEIGRPTLEKVSDLELKEYLSRTTSSGHFQIRPNDPVRLECAKLFAWLALKRVFLHEVGHIVLGHLEGLPSNGVVAISERDNGELSDGEYRQKQCLEAQADMYSAWVLAEFWDGYFNYFGNRIPQIDSQPFKYLGVITAWEFRRQNSLEMQPDNLVRRSHPRSDVRFHHFWVCFYGKLQSKPRCTDDQFINQFTAGDLAVVEIWKRLGFQAVNFDAEKDNFGSIVTEVEKLQAGIQQCETTGLKKLREARAARVRQIHSTGS